MKPFLDPFPFRKPETRSSIGEVIAKITNTEVVQENHTRAQLEKMTTTELRAEVVKARLAARGEKRGGGAAQDKAADAVAVRLGGKTKP
jgi:hypothetical protein